MEGGRDRKRRHSKEDKGSDMSKRDRERGLLEKVDGGAKDMSVPKRKHFVELKHI